MQLHINRLRLRNGLYQTEKRISSETHIGQKESSPNLLPTHCIAHSLALGCGSGADNAQYLVKFHEILNSIDKYFSFFPKHMAALEAIQTDIDGQINVGSGSSVSAVVKNYSALLSVYLQENLAKVLCLYNPVSSFKFLYCTHFLADDLKQLCILSKINQIKIFLKLIHFCVLLLQYWRVLGKVSLVVFCQNLSVPFLLDLFWIVMVCLQLSFKATLSGMELSSFKRQFQHAKAFVTHTVENFRARFSNSEDAKIMSAMCSVLNPGSLGEQRELTSFRSFVQVQVAKKSKGVKTGLILPS
ncbi:LOW QUALITY PROTEIN: hypothetical protein KUTeg_022166 [Tegillarca granosa]|uniref:Uncharacterized protein n=1 Tax=Tegillarca granosa TaxID=220873 RepID=A0ABQ9E9T8_TEGGR|nr:LOW QUALITY PROTEIN: hypothetical protein KUTeg_022166 [Tegillarca granosa]